MLEILNNTMAGAIRAISIERGYDPRDFVLLACGGAGPLHAGRLAELLEMPTVIIPRYSGVLSTLGLLHSDIKNDYVRTLLQRHDAFDLAALKGKPVLVDFFASWCAPCAAVAPAVVRFAADHPEIAIVGVSLDNPQTMADLPGFMAKHAITWPVIGEKLGWDGELDDAWRVDGIPALILVGADGKILANELVGISTEATLEALEKAVKALPKAKDAAVPFP
jgi:thiol-disulfide isomerase/thioredoxin